MTGVLASETSLRRDQPLDRRLDRGLTDRLLGDPDALAAAEREILASGLVEHLERQAALFWTTVQGTTRGHRYNTGRATGRDGYGEGLRLYAVVRKLRPRVAVETGVCNGVSTAFLLLALAENGDGELHSLDLPEIAGEDYEAGTFWDGKGGAVIPPGQEPGWMVPGPLRDRWQLVLGRSQQELPPLLERVGSIDFFMHDSEHSEECMRFEFEAAWGALRDGGVLAADDVDANDAFAVFAAAQGREPIEIGPKLALLVK
jgi:predicted O-methyltransferase YrrM